MNDDAKINSHGSATTLDNELRREVLGESDAIELAAYEARLAARNAWDDLQKSLQSGADPRQWARSHPWLTLGVASVVGFAAAVEAAELIAGRRREEQEHADGAPNASSHGSAKSSANGGRGGGSSPAHYWIDRLFDLAKATLSAGLATAIRSSASENSENGAAS